MIDNYDALTLGRFMQIDALLRSDADELDKQVEIIAILADKTVDEVLLLPLQDYTDMAAKTAFLREPCKPTEIDADYKWNGLVPVTDFRKINTAQYVDFQAFAKDFPETLPQLLSVFLVPEGKAYCEGYDVGLVQERVKGVRLADALGLAAFFFERFVILIEDSLTSWATEAKRTKDPMKKAAALKKLTEVQNLLQSAGVGLPM